MEPHKRSDNTITKMTQEDNQISPSNQATNAHIYTAAVCVPTYLSWIVSNTAMIPKPDREGTCTSDLRTETPR